MDSAAQIAGSPGGAPSGEDQASIRTLAIDIGGTGLKCGILDGAGALIAGPSRIATPHPSPPDVVINAVANQIADLGPFHRVSLGFPGMIRRGVVLTAPNLGTPAWHGFPLAAAMATRLGRPTRMLNDATVQGLGVIIGRGLECVITLGTGFGFGLFDNGRPAPQLELGQHIARGDLTYDHYLGHAAYDEIGRKAWNERLAKVLRALEVFTGFDALYVGGGLTHHIEIDMPDHVSIVSNDAGITGGVRLWDRRLDDLFTVAEDQAHAFA